MMEALEGSQALARAVATCRPQVVAAYPITPQTHIVEHLSRIVADGGLCCEFVSVESEFSAASVVLGAACAGARAYTATASQGILLMSEVLYNIAGMRVPLVLTCANRAVSAPLSIWNDQQDSMAMRDAGWIQLYCADNQEAVDTTIQAYRIAEQLELPVMVCVDGFTLTHTLEPIEVPEQAQVDAFLPEYHFSRPLDSRAPLSLGTLVAPDYFTEVREDHHQALQSALTVIEQARTEWREVSGRDTAGLLEVFDAPGAEVGVMTIGSMTGTFREAREQFSDLPSTRLLRLRSFRPFPAKAVREACAGLKKLVVVERALSPGAGAIVGSEVKSALYGMADAPAVQTMAVGLGGRDINPGTYRQVLADLDGDSEFRIADLEPDKLPEANP